MTTDTRENALWISNSSCYIEGNDIYNPYRLTLYIDSNGIIMLGAEGNGCADDIILDDIDGWSNEDINENWGGLDIEQLLSDANAMRLAGHEDEADWLEGWCRRARRAKGTKRTTI